MPGPLAAHIPASDPLRVFEADKRIDISCNFVVKSFVRTATCVWRKTKRRVKRYHWAFTTHYILGIRQITASIASAIVGRKDVTFSAARPPTAVVIPSQYLVPFNILRIATSSCYRRTQNRSSVRRFDRLQGRRRLEFPAAPGPFYMPPKALLAASARVLVSGIHVGVPKQAHPSVGVLCLPAHYT